MQRNKGGDHVLLNLFLKFCEDFKQLASHLTGGSETDVSGRGFRESEEADFGEFLANSESAGQETVSIMDTASNAPFG